jgi:hypothetical protein
VFTPKFSAHLTWFDIPNFSFDQSVSISAAKFVQFDVASPDFVCMSVYFILELRLLTASDSSIVKCYFQVLIFDSLII